MKKRSVATLVLFLIGSFATIKAQPKNSNGPVRLSESYELANTILALTDYGKTDRWEVSQNSDYYRQVRTYFDRFAGHPLLAKVNYSRAKWDSYLSFRTDAYAFAFDGDNRLRRTKKFYADEGLNPFEENLELVNDFVKVTGFRQFYKNHLAYYQKLATAYLRSQHYPQMLAFLEKEMGKRPEVAAYAIVMSPLVGRMNCHRMVAGTGTDFITVPDYLLNENVRQEATQADIASGTHMLFTELDHAFVNPLTEKYQKLLQKNFTISKWDAGSGYEKDSLATFNEYMTWAVYDLYVQACFPKVAAQVSTDWALQNDTRGFYASSLFNRELLELYNHRKHGQFIKDLYPALIGRIGMLQNEIAKPVMVSCNLDNQTTPDTLASFIIRFSEPMQELRKVDVIRAGNRDGKAIQERVELTGQGNDLAWSEGGTVLLFKLKLASAGLNKIILNYPWETLTPLRTLHGVDLPPYTIIKTTVKLD